MDLRIYALGKDEGQAVWSLTTLTLVKATAKQTANTFGLIEWDAPAVVIFGDEHHAELRELREVLETNKAR